jgi:hypothetical protein
MRSEEDEEGGGRGGEKRKEKSLCEHDEQFEHF